MKRTHKMDQKLKKLRKKYAEGYVSDYFLKTGEPLHIKERVDEAEEQLKKMQKQNDKNIKKAEKEAKKIYAKNCKKKGKEPEKEVVFI